MAKIRSGIEIPIIPEDFVDADEELSLDMIEFYLQWTYRYIQEGLEPGDLTTADSDFDQCQRMRRLS
jgi:hypothetical protein